MSDRWQSTHLSLLSNRRLRDTRQPSDAFSLIDWASLPSPRWTRLGWYQKNVRLSSTCYSLSLYSACQLGRKSWIHQNAQIFLCQLFLFLLVPEFRLYKYSIQILPLSKREKAAGTLVLVMNWSSHSIATLSLGTRNSIYRRSSITHGQSATARRFCPLGRSLYLLRDAFSRVHSPFFPSTN